MKRIILIAFVATLAMGFGIWGIWEGSAVEEHREFTRDEQAVLLSSGTPQERIADNRLTQTEEKLLRRLSAAQAFLAERYPEEPFVFTGVDNTTPHGRESILLAASEWTPDESFAVRVREDNGMTVIQESHFSDLKRDELYAWIERTLADMGIQAVCDLEIPGLFGAEADPRLPIEQLLEQRVGIGVMGWVLAQAPLALEERKEAIEQRLIACGLQGGFRMLVVEGISLEEALQASRAERSFVTAEAFISLPGQGREVQ